MAQLMTMDPDTSTDTIPVISENFELWLRMATDNKITTENTWNFALIDYFHDFRMLKDGDSVNFIKASTALDGCTKIYSNRVESAVKDTGSLLTTLNLRSKKKVIDNDDNEDEDEEDDEDEDEEVVKRKRKQKRMEKKKADYLLTSFKSLSIKESDRPVKFDPVFKNALSEFDEGGAKSLLNNILTITPSGKVSFDFELDETVTSVENIECDFTTLNNMIDFDLSNSKNSVCPSLNDLKEVMDGKKDAVVLLETLDKIDVSFVLEQQIEILKANSGRHPAEEKEVGQYDNDVILPDYDNDYDDHEFDFSFPKNYTNKDNVVDEANGSNGPNDTNVSKRTQYSLYVDGVSDDEDDSFGPNLTLNRLFEEEPMEANNYTIGNPNRHDEKLLDFFEQMDSKPQLYWKIARVKRNYLNSELNNNYDDNLDNAEDSEERIIGRRYRKKKQAQINDYQIDFFDDSQDKNEDDIFETTEQLSKIMLREKQRKSGRHLMPNVSFFATKSLAFLTIKPNQMIYSQRRFNRSVDDDDMNSEYFAKSYNETVENVLNDSLLSPPPDYGSDPFNDPNEFIDPTGIEGFDAPLPTLELHPFPNSQSQTQSQLQMQTQSQQQFSVRSNMLYYERRAKKVDIKLLKTNIWKSIESISIQKKKRHDEFHDDNPQKILHTEATSEHLVNESNQSDEQTDENSDSAVANDGFHSDESDADNKDAMHFTNVVKEVARQYDDKTKSDLSTSFCFICLLHLANEQGLTLETENNYQDIVIHK
ncbi:hypothetical protein CANINC_002876 [Pichia inconspicua]|uniref:Condensin complex subunit 2 n=1 Tax=Pichia inconspicua TaxID=52247 RepID=A0A4T0X024_9ASCO|nr:hypothetical protein CANINC_002876 [[Candida] inconspicua]